MTFKCGCSPARGHRRRPLLLHIDMLQWRTTPWKRRLITRMIGMVPSLVVSASVGESGVNTLLVASQVTLSIVLPFVMFP